MAARINGINAVIIAECNRAARKLTSGPVPAPIGAGRGEVYKRLNVAAREIYNNRAVVVDVRSRRHQKVRLDKPRWSRARRRARMRLWRGTNPRRCGRIPLRKAE